MSTILITGCSTGIGFATAELMARSGHQVYATMRNPQRAPELDQLARLANLPITVLPMDVDSDEFVTSAVAQVLAQAGRIDVLINNAGIAPVGAVEEMPFATIQQVMQTNYFGTVRCIQAVLPIMRKQGGCIINVSSIAGEMYSACFGAYCATKAAIEALSESLAGEVAQFGIRVAVVQPGVIDTPLIDKADDVPINTLYPTHARLKAYLSASAAANHVPASAVAEVIQVIAAGEQTAFRNPVGADAGPLLGWRASLSDEDWIASAGMDEETWIAGMAQLGVDVRPYLNVDA